MHVRIDSFFASVEQRRRPELAGRAVIVAQARGNTSGVVVSASRQAAGVGQGTSVRQARRTCPDAVVIMADHAIYRQVSEEFLDILARYSPLLEPDSLGGAYLDVTASRALFGDAPEIASRIASEVTERLGLPVCIGCASKKLVARAAGTRSGGVSGPSRTPLICVSPGSEAAFLAPLPVSVLGSVSARIEKRLSELGVSTVGQLAMIPERLLARQFGPVGSLVKRESMGIDSSHVRAAYPPEVIITEHMFESALEEPAEVELYLRRMTDEAVARLRKGCKLAGEVTLKLFGAGELQIAECRMQIAECRMQNAECRTPSPLAGEGWGEGEVCIPAYFRFKKPTDSAASIAQALEKLLGSKMMPGMQVSRVEVTLSDLVPGAVSQLSLIGEGERKSRLDRAIELVRERFGERSVFLASALVPAGGARALSRLVVSYQ